MKSTIIMSIFLWSTITKCTSLTIEKDLNDLDQDDPKLVAFIRKSLLEPPPTYPEKIEDMITNLEVHTYLPILKELACHLL